MKLPGFDTEWRFYTSSFGDHLSRRRWTANRVTGSRPDGTPIMEGFTTKHLEARIAELRNADSPDLAEYEAALQRLRWHESQED